MEEITSTGHELIESEHYALSKLVLFYVFKKFTCFIFNI